MSNEPDRRFFFVHVMKTGGASFRQHIFANFPDDAVYPRRPFEPDLNTANWSIDHLLGLAPDRRAVLQAYTGHFPFVVTDLLDEELTTLTILRHPVERTVSYLKHSKRYDEGNRDRSLEEIYEDKFSFECLIRDHQSKVFSMRADDKLESYMDVIDVDERRLAEACRNLERVDVVGLQEHYGEFQDEFARRFGWRFDVRAPWRVGEPEVQVSQDFRRRIAEDNPADMAFYEHARLLHERRRQIGT